MSLKEQQSHLQQQLGNTETHLIEVKRELEEKVIQVRKLPMYCVDITRCRAQTTVKLSSGYQWHWLIKPSSFCQVKIDRFLQLLALFITLTFIHLQ